MVIKQITVEKLPHHFQLLLEELQIDAKEVLHDEDWGDLGYSVTFYSPYLDDVPLIAIGKAGGTVKAKGINLFEISMT